MISTLKKIILLILFSVSVNYAFADWIWTKKTSLPLGNKRDRAVSFSINGWGFLGTGLDSANLVRADFWKYDTLTDAWSQVADFPGVPRRDAVAFVIDSFGYVGTGIADSSAWGSTLMDFYRYNPFNNSWDSIAPYSNGTAYGVYKAVAGAAAGKGYVITGRYFGTPYYQTWMYDPALNYWIQKADFPVFYGRNGAVSFSIGTKIYLATGSDDNYFYNDLWEYDAVTDAWSQKQNFPGTSRIGAVGFTIDTLGIVGSGTDGGYTNDFWAYNPAINSWSYVNQFPGDARRGATAFTVSKNGYISCGKSAFGTKRDLWQLKYKAPQLPNNINTVTTGNSMFLYPNIVSYNTFIHLAYGGNKKTEILIYSSLGKLIYKTSNQVSEIFISPEIFSATGEYFVGIKNTTDHSALTFQKLIVL